MGSGTPTFAIPSGKFLNTFDGSWGDITIVGIPFDLGTSNRAGTREGPDAIRRASRMLIDGAHPFHGIDPQDKLKIGDAGNFALVQSDLMGSIAAIRENAAKFDHLVALGGDHSITLPLLQALKKKHGPLGLLHFDAHLDTWPDNFGGINYGHGNPFYHAIEQGLVDPKRMIQIGIRSPVDPSIAEWTVRQGAVIVTSIDVHRGHTFYICDLIERVLGDKPAYLTIDIDALDPAFAPGTGTPEIGGLMSWQLQDILRNIRKPVNFVGMDVVEVSPPFDHAEITALAAATYVWEYLTRMAKYKT